MNGWVRIIGGMWRGRHIVVPEVVAVRPTPNRVRETVFNWLQGAIVDAICLDAFAGSGALGFEALSRSAKHVTFVEMDKHVAQQLKKTAEELKTNDINVVPHTFEQARFHQQFDIVFLDPPFHRGLVSVAAKKLEDEGALASRALIYTETEAELITLDMPPNWHLCKQKKAGEVSYSLWQRTDNV